MRQILRGEQSTTSCDDLCFCRRAYFRRARGSRFDGHKKTKQKIKDERCLSAFPHFVKRPLLAPTAASSSLSLPSRRVSALSPSPTRRRNSPHVRPRGAHICRRCKSPRCTFLFFCFFFFMTLLLPRTVLSTRVSAQSCPAPVLLSLCDPSLQYETDNNGPVRWHFCTLTRRTAN